MSDLYFISLSSSLAQDLDTVDDGIEAALLGGLQQQPWDLFIAHFLGVDHIGHSHNAFHPLMTERFILFNAIFFFSFQSSMHVVIRLDRMDRLLLDVIKRCVRSICMFTILNDN